MGVPLLKGDDLYETFSWFIREKVCREALERLVEQLFDGHLEHSPLAYVTAGCLSPAEILFCLRGFVIIFPWCPACGFLPLPEDMSERTCITKYGRWTGMKKTRRF